MEILIAHATGEESYAEELAAPLRDAGYEVLHRGTVLVGESFTEESTRVLAMGGPIVLCATVRALGTGLAHRLVHAARATEQQAVRVFIVQMEEEVYVSPLSLDGTVAHYWRDPNGAVSSLLASLRRYYPLPLGPTSTPLRYDPEERYRDLLLSSCDLIDLANLSLSDRHLAARQLELRRLYVALRVHPESAVGDLNQPESELPLSGKRPLRRRLPLGQRLGEARRLIVLGEPGSGKTTLLRWIATACLLRRKGDPSWRELRDVSTLPDENWLPVLVRCRDLTATCLEGALLDILTHTLRRLEIVGPEGESLSSILLDRLIEGRAILLVDGLDEITDVGARARFCRHLEQVHLAFPKAFIVATARMVGYREMGYRIGRGFEHLTLAELSRRDKDAFAQRWCDLTELPERRAAAAQELIQDIHSTDRIERLAGNPMLLTCMALVKRSVGRLPSRRADLYRDVLETLLNWRREVDEPVDPREAISQLEYLAYAMCDCGVQQLREDEIVALFERMREEYPSVHAARRRSADEFLHLLERQTGLLVETGRARHLGRLLPIFEFRHLTFQEYLAGMALVDGRFPGRDRSRSIADHVTHLAGRVSGVETPDAEIEVMESWREALRICLVCCNDDAVDAHLESMLKRLPNEDSHHARARAVLAGWCLADEPNVSETVARKVLQALSFQVRENDNEWHNGTSLHAAAVQISRSRWAELLASVLLDRFLIVDGELRITIGTLFSHVLEDGLARGENIQGWLSSQLSALSSDEPKQAVHAALGFSVVGFRAFVKSLPPETVEALISLLWRSDAEALAAAWALDWLQRRTIWQPLPQELELIVTFVSEEECEVSTLCFLSRILRGKIEGDAVDTLTRRLLSALASSDTFGSLRAARALGHIRSESAVNSLAALLNDPRPKLRRRAAEALGEIGAPAAVSALCVKLHDEDMGVVRQAAWSIGVIKSKEGLQALTSRLQVGDEDLPAEVALALGRIGGERAMDLLLSELAGAVGKRRDAIANGLYSIALDRFNAGEIAEAARDFSRLLSIARPCSLDDLCRNAVAYCSMLLGNLAEAGEQLSNLESEELLWQHNRGVLAFLQGDAASGIRSLQEALSWIEDEAAEDAQHLYMLLLDQNGSIRSVANVPIGVATLQNLWRMGGITAEKARSELESLYPHLLEPWGWLFANDEEMGTPLQA